MRQFVTYNGQIYTATGKGTTSSGDTGGAVLRLTGMNGATPQFVEIGTLDSVGAYIAVHQNQLFVTTWPTATSLAALFMSPTIPANGFAGEVSWTKVWNASQYEPDPVTAASYATGALTSFDGYLYWGTMHVPWAATGVFLEVYGVPQTTNEWINAVVGTFRTTTIFRGQNFSTTPSIQLLYGSPVLEAYTPPSGNTAGQWNLFRIICRQELKILCTGLPDLATPITPIAGL